MEKIFDVFGYEPSFGNWYPDEELVRFNVTCTDVKQPDGTTQKQWLVEHNLNYYDLVFLGKNALGIEPEEIKGEMIVKACLAARLNGSSVFFTTTFAQLAALGQLAEEKTTDEIDWLGITKSFEDGLSLN